MTWPPEETAKKAAAQLGLAIVFERTGAQPHDHLQAAAPMSPLDFAERLLVYCFRFRASVTSWGRTSARNAIVKGVPDSRHQTWTAGDVVYD